MVTTDMSANVNFSTVDGMGFEEVNQSSYTEMISGNNLYGNNLWISDMAEMNIVSGATFSGGQAIFEDMVIRDDFDARVVSADGNRLWSTSIQNATELFGYKVKAGSVKTDDAGEGVILFASAGSFSTVHYFMTLTPRDWTLPAASGLNFMLSGTRRASGCEMFGPSGTVYDWIAVGL